MMQPKFEVISGGKADLIKRAEKVSVDRTLVFRLEEKKPFPEREIHEVIGNVAEKDGFTRDELALKEETYNAYQELLEVMVQVMAEGKVKGRGWQSLHYRFIHKGRYEGDNRNHLSRVIRIYNIDQGLEAEQVAAEYESGKWNYLPDYQK